jgi:hypothetical protein
MFLNPEVYDCDFKRQMYGGQSDIKATCAAFSRCTVKGSKNVLIHAHMLVYFSKNLFLSHMI